MANLGGNIDGGKMKKIVMVLMAVCWAINNGGGVLQMVAAEVHHHVVGDDQGWATSSDLASWLSGRVFTTGDILWFAYSSGSESIMEVQTLEEFMACDLTNPIRMYTKGLDKVSLDAQGTRFFTSTNLESCKNGLKIPVHVQLPQAYSIIKRDQNLAVAVAADGPTSPSAAPHIATAKLPFALFVGLLVFYMGL